MSSWRSSGFRGERCLQVPLQRLQFCRLLEDWVHEALKDQLVLRGPAWVNGPQMEWHKIKITKGDGATVKHDPWVRASSCLVDLPSSPRHPAVVAFSRSSIALIPLKLFAGSSTAWSAWMECVKYNMRPTNWKILVGGTELVHKNYRKHNHVIIVIPCLLESPHPNTEACDLEIFRSSTSWDSSWHPYSFVVTQNSIWES